MLRHKKLIFGLCLLLGIASSGWLLAQKVFAAPECKYAACSNEDILAADGTYVFVDEATITGIFGTKGTGTTVTFKDALPGKEGGAFSKIHIFVAQDEVFCGGGSDNKGNITIPDQEWQKVQAGASSINAVLDVDWSDATANIGGDTCPDFKANGEKNYHTISITNVGQAANTSYYWDNDDIVAADGSVTLSFAKKAQNEEYYLYKTGDLCGRIVVINAPGANKGVEYELQFPGGGLDDAAIKSALLRKFYEPGACKIKSGPTDVNIAGTKGTPAGGVEPSGGDECESKNVGDFLWILCPALRQADTAAEGLNGFVNDQLCVNTGGSLTQGTRASPCGGQNILNDGVHKAWAIFKNIATAALIIIMIIIIYAQATGSTFLDAYSARKALPRLVAAVILIQLSWIALKFAVDLTNDLGQGIQTLLYAPFGGADNMTLDSLFGKQAGDINTSKEQFAFFSVIAATGVVAIANIPGLIAMAILVVLALFVAFFVLILRKVLIILLVILAPLALIAWILSANDKSDRLWKQWSSNFTKLLMMYPLIMGMIAAGRIFAYIVAHDNDPTAILTPHLAVAHLGPLPVPYIATVTDFAGLVIVLIAFFGPYFLLPKAFSWGGTFMAVAAGAVTGSKLAQNAREKSSAAARGYGERWQGKRAKMYDPNANIFSKGLRRVQSGHFLPTERSRRLAIAEGDKWAAERNDEASAYTQRTYEKALSGYDRVMTDENGKYQRYKRDASGNLLDKNGNVTTDKSEATKEEVAKELAEVEKLTGVEAGKQALVDIAGNDGVHLFGKMFGTDRIKKDALMRSAMAAHKQLIDTHSEIEIQKARIQGGAYEGKRVTEVPTFDDTLINSPPHYSALNSSRFDLAPDVKEGAEKKISEAEGKKINYQDADPDQTKKLDIARLGEALKRMTPEHLASVHYGFFEDIARVNDEGLSKQLAESLYKFNTQAGVLGQNAVGSLRGGKEEKVEKALKAAGISSLDQALAGGAGGAGGIVLPPERRTRE